ncbi:hypothetical protein ACWCY6_28230 [Streptomyces sp. 900105755]
MALTTAEERAAVLELMNSVEYAELPPAQIWARELDAGRYHCSISTTDTSGDTAAVIRSPIADLGARREIAGATHRAGA